MTVQSGSGYSQLFHGEIRDIQDPDNAGKMKIIVHGHHNVGPTPIPDSDLPWAHCMMNNSPSLNGIGSTAHYLPGTTIIGMWLDPDTKQIPIILGSIHRAGLTSQGS